MANVYTVSSATWLSTRTTRISKPMPRKPVAARRPTAAVALGSVAAADAAVARGASQTRTAMIAARRLNTTQAPEARSRPKRGISHSAMMITPITAPMVFAAYNPAIERPSRACAATARSVAGSVTPMPEGRRVRADHPQHGAADRRHRHGEQQAPSRRQRFRCGIPTLRMRASLNSGTERECAGRKSGEECCNNCQYGCRLVAEAQGKLLRPNNLVAETGEARSQHQCGREAAARCGGGGYRRHRMSPVG